jgi:hypothetical protein
MYSAAQAASYEGRCVQIFLAFLQWEFHVPAVGYLHFKVPLATSGAQGSCAWSDRF